MASLELLNQLNQTFALSPTFQLLSVEKQDELKQAFASAADDQLSQAIAELNKLDLAVAQDEEKRKAREQRQIELAEELKKELAELEKIERKENENTENMESAREAERILSSLASIESEDKPKPKKKFLGLF